MSPDAAVMLAFVSGERSAESVAAELDDSVERAAEAMAELEAAGLVRRAEAAWPS